MREKTWLRALFLFCTILICLTGCGGTKMSLTSFEGAASERSFPVPKDAIKTEQPTGNQEMNYERYSLPGLKEDEGIPEAYLDAIKSWGWIEEKKNTREVDEPSEAMDYSSEEDGKSSRIFYKDNKAIQVIVHDDYLIIMLPEANSKAVIQGLDIK